jgi:hypothetical protein
MPVRKLKYIAIVIVALAVTGLVLPILRIKLLEQHYNQVEKGQSKESVEARLGKPAEIKRCTENIWWDAQFLKKNKGECQEEFWYYSHITPEMWTIGFDENGRVISKYHYVSP